MRGHPRLQRATTLKAQTSSNLPCNASITKGHGQDHWIYGDDVNGGWRKSRVIAVFVFTLVLAAQLIIPVSRLAGGQHAQRFGWQMFSGSEAFPNFAVVTSEGVKDVSIEDYLVTNRVELDVVGAFPPHLCEVFPNAREIVWDGNSHRC